MRDIRIPISDRLRCPVKWCRIVFDNTTKLLNHIRKCSRLNEGLYWCPYCEKDERFSSPVLREKCTQRCIRNCKDAVKALSNYGSKSLRKATRLSKKRCRACVEQPLELMGEEIMSDNDDLRLMEGQFAELDDLSFATTPPIQLGLNSAELCGISQPCEMEDAVPAAELGCGSFSLPASGWDEVEMTTPNLSLSPVSPVSPNTPVTPNQSRNRLWYASNDSPVSPTDADDFSSLSSRSYPCIDADMTLSILDFPYPDLSTHSQPLFSTTTSLEEFSTISSAVQKDVCKSLPSIRIDTSVSDVQAFVWTSSDYDSFVENVHSRVDAGTVADLTKIEAREAPASTDFSNARPTKLFEDIRDIFGLVLQESMQKMCQEPMSEAAATYIRTKPSFNFMFRNGLVAVQKILRNILPTTFWEVFGVAHLAYASAILLDPQDLVLPFAHIFRDLRYWSKAISSEREKAAFLQLIGEIWAPDFQDKLYSGANTFSDSPQVQDLHRLEISASALLGHILPKPSGSTNGYSAALQDNFDRPRFLADHLSKGDAVGFCLRYLDGMFDAEHSFLQIIANIEEKLSNTQRFCPVVRHWVYGKEVTISHTI